jgi:hypothetical protein
MLEADSDAECGSPTSSPCYMGEHLASFLPDGHSTCQNIANPGNLVDADEKAFSSPFITVSSVKNESQMDVDPIPESKIHDTCSPADPCNDDAVDVAGETCLGQEVTQNTDETGETLEELANGETVDMPSPVSADTGAPASGCDRDRRDSHSEHSFDSIPSPFPGMEQEPKFSNQKKRNEEKHKDTDKKETKEPSRKKARLSPTPLGPHPSNGASSVESQTKKMEGHVKSTKSKKRMSVTVELKKVATQTPLADAPLPSPTRQSSECDHPETSSPIMTQSHTEMHGLLIETFATSRASSLPISGLYKAVMQSRPLLQNQKSAEEWKTIIGEVLERGRSPVGSGVFTKVDCNGMVCLFKRCLVSCQRWTHDRVDLRMRTDVLNRSGFTFLKKTRIRIEPCLLKA